MRKRWGKWLLIGLASYLVVLIITVPVRPVYSLLAKQLAPLKLQGVQGTLWDGRAATVHYDQIRVGSLNWNFALREILGGRFGFFFMNQDNHTQTSGIAGISLLGQTYMNNVNGFAPAANVYNMLSSYPLNVNGKVNYQLQQVRLADNWVQSIQGNMTWRNAAIRSPFAATLGTLELLLSTEQNNLQIQVSNQGGHLGIEGTITVHADKRIQTDLLLTPRKNANPNLVNVLRSFGKSDRSGRISIKYNGYI